VPRSPSDAGSVELVLSTRKLTCEEAATPATRAADEVRIWLRLTRGPSAGDYGLTTAGFVTPGQILSERGRAVIEGANVADFDPRPARSDRTRVDLRARLARIGHEGGPAAAEVLTLDGRLEADGCGDAPPESD
jgi:hypothetical protein